MQEHEGLAGLEVLVAIAKADGKLLFEEKRALEFCLDGITLPEGTTLDALIDKDIDVDAALKKITVPESRQEVYEIAVAMANVDGHRAKEEDALLDKIRSAFGMPKVGLAADVAKETKDTFLLSNIEAVTDPARRGAEISEDTLKYSIMSAVLGAFPVPGLAIVTDIAVVALQAKLVRDIGQYWGHKMDDKTVKSVIGGILGSAGLRIAVNNLVKLVPGWGSVFGATTSFATTWGVGKVADKYFASGGKLAPADLKKEFAAAKKEGEGAYKEKKSAIDAKADKDRAVLVQLAEDLKAEKISQADYDKRVMELV
ncbi:MAG: GTPase protein [Myxococcaceae bacterium]|jgi:uncharacterized protein (DUF697 family)|nr:GTPase protein [Myxococcaceae bacterium]